MEVQMIRVCSKRNGGVGEYIGRPSVLGNPFKLEQWGREACIEQYEVWLRERIAARDVQVCKELSRLLAIARAGELKLVCWCAPLACHGDVIKRVLEEKIS
jgi:hypothetical protein